MLGGALHHFPSGKAKLLALSQFCRLWLSRRSPGGGGAGRPAPGLRDLLSKKNPNIRP
jgi:hypothetical protein